MGLIERLLSPNFCGLIFTILTNRDSSWTKSIKEQFPQLNIAHDWFSFKALPKPKLLIMHAEGTRGKRRVTSKGIRHQAFDKKLVKDFWDLVVIDECQRLKNPTSMLSRMARQLRNCLRRVALSGTPIDGNELDMWAQMRFIDYEVLGDDRHEFDAEYVKKTGFMGYKKIFRPEKRDRFHRVIKPYCLRLEIDSLGVKRAVIHKVDFDLTGRQREIYDEMESDAVTYLGNNRAMAELPITMQLRLHQITGGHLATDDGEIRIAGRAKIKRFREFLDSKDARTPMVVFCKFKPDVEAVLDEVRKRYQRVEVLWGDTGTRNKKAQVRAELNQRFQSGEIDVLVCQQKTGAVGIDLYSSTCGVIYSCSFSFIDWDQMIARLVRRGQTGQAEFWFLCARNTIDDDLYSAVKEKGTVSSMFLSRLKRRSHHG